MSVRARNGAEAVCADERLDAGDRRRAPAPAGDAEAEPEQRPGRVAAKHPHAHDADAHVGGLRLWQVLPGVRRLLAGVGRRVAVVRQHLQRHPFGHPPGEVGRSRS